MTVEQLRKTYDKQPFEPFDLFLADGRKVSVPHRDFMLVPPVAQRTFAVADQDGLIETIDLLLVVSITPISQSQNGIHRKSA